MSKKAWGSGSKAVISTILILTLVCAVPGLIPKTHAYYVSASIVVSNGAYGIGVNTYTNKIYITQEGHGQGNSVSVIDGSTDTVLSTITTGKRPSAIGVNEVTNKIYVARLDTQQITVIDGSSDTVSTNIPICCDNTALSLGVNQVTNKIYTANNFQGQVSVIDGSTNTVTSTVSVGGGGGASGPQGIAVNEVTNKVYVAMSISNSVAVIDGSTDTLIATVPVGSGVTEVAVNPVTNMIYASNFGTNTVSVIDGSTNTVVATINVGSGPTGLDVDESRNRVYVAVGGASVVSVIDGSTNSVISTITGTGNPNGLAVNGQTEKIYDVDRNGFVNVIRDFEASISASPASRTVLQGDSTSYNVASTLVVGPTQAMTLSVSGLPSGASATFTPASISPSASSTLSIATANNTPAGSYTLTITANGGGITRIASVGLVVNPRNSAPDCSNAAPSHDNLVPPVVLWPPNHTMKSIAIQGVTDPDNDSITVSITAIRQDEPTSGLGSGDQSPDGSGIGTSTASVRVEREGTNDGRVYHIFFSAADGHGGSCNGEVNVSVPHSQTDTGAVDEGPLYDSTV